MTSNDPTGATEVRPRELTLPPAYERFRQLFAAIDDGYCIFQMQFDAQGRPVDYRFLEANAAFERHTGLTNALGRTARELVPNLDDSWFELYGNVALTGEPARFENHAPAMGRWFDVYALRIGPPTERLVALVFKDVTERRLAESKVQESAARHRFLLELSDLLRPLTDPAEVQYESARALGERLGVARVGYAELAADEQSLVVMRQYANGVANLEGQYLYAEYDRTLPSELRAGRTVGRSDIANDEGLSEAERFSHRALEAAATLNVPLVKDGQLRAVLFVHDTRPHVWTQGELALVEEAAARTWDAVERARAEAARQESEERFRNMADNAPVMLWVTDANGWCEYLSRSWYEFTGQTKQTGLGLGWLQVVHPDDATYAQEVFLAANARHEPFRIDYRLRRRDGVYRWAIDSASPRFDSRGEFLGYVGSVIDITDRKLAEQEREKLLAREQSARLQAEEANRMKDEFLSTVSHELRTPLTAILGWAQMLRSDALPADKRERGLETIARNARAQGQLIEDLLDVSRIISGKLRLEVETVDVSAVVEQALETVRPAADAKGVRLQAAVDSTGMVMGDAQRLQQIVWNLVANGVKFTSRGGRVNVIVERRDSSVEITVADTGQGIAPEFLPHVFERFRQADASSKRQHGGLGLGLSIVRHLTELHGGSVSVHSEGVAKGATFVVRLPLAVASRRELSASAHSHSQGRASGLECPSELAGMNILVVDDEADTREFLKLMLEECSARVTLASSAAEALEAIAQETPSVVVSDIGMPGEDGFTLIRRLRALPASRGGRVPAVALTAYARTEERTRILLSGFNHHLAKPVDPLELLAILASLARSGAIAQSRR